MACLRVTGHWSMLLVLQVTDQKIVVYVPWTAAVLPDRASCSLSRFIFGSENFIRPTDIDLGGLLTLGSFTDGVDLFLV